MYGRIVTEHHHNPYDSYPMHFEGDPMRRHVSAIWQRTPDIYGPAFTVVMAALAPVIGESTFLARFLYQLIAGAAVGALLWLLWKRTRSPTALAFVGLHPLVSVSVINGGHPDALIALAFLLAFLLALERRVVLCALALAFGVAINFSVIAAAAALGVWAARRWTRPEIVKLAVITLGLGAAPYLFLSGWLDNAKAHQELISRLSIWNPLASLLTDSGPFPFVSLTTRQLRTVMPNSTTLMAALLLIFVLVRFTGRRTPELAIAGRARGVPRDEPMGDALVRVRRVPVPRHAQAEPADLVGRDLQRVHPGERPVPVAVAAGGREPDAPLLPDCRARARVHRVRRGDRRPAARP